MKKYTYYIYSLAVAVMMLAATGAKAQSWDFSYVSDADKANLAADTDGWEYETSNNRYKNKTTYDAAPLKANGAELQITKGLLFTAGVADAVRVDIKGKRISLNKAGTTITIENLKAGMTLTMSCKSSVSYTHLTLPTTSRV